MARGRHRVVTGCADTQGMSVPSARRVLVSGSASGHGEEIVFDERDPASVRRAEAALEARFGVSMAGLLTSEPPEREGTLRRALRAVRDWL